MSYFVKCIAKNVPEKAIENNGDVKYASYAPRLGITKSPDKDKFTRFESKSEAERIARKIDRKRYDVEIIEE